MESEVDQTAPFQRKPKEHLPGKENSSSYIKRSEVLSSPELTLHHAASSSECSSHHSVGSMPSGHTGEEHKAITCMS